MQNNILETSQSPPKAIPAKFYKGKYIVTADGRIYTISDKYDGYIHRQRTRIKPNGYFRAHIHGHDEYVHRIVAQCFIPNPEGLLEINHKDGNKANNAVENLEWSTRSANNRHAFQTGLRDYAELRKIASGPRPSLRRFTGEDIMRIHRLLNDKVGVNAIARMFGVRHSSIQQIRDGKIYKEYFTQC